MSCCCAKIGVKDIHRADKLKQLVFENDLIKSGHYSLSEDISIRDWLDTTYFFENPDHFQDIANDMMNIFKLDIGKYTFVGANHSGNLIASYIGFRTGNPFTYHIFKEKQRFHGENEVKMYDISEKNVVIICDVLITGQHVQSAINTLTKDSQVKVVSIWSIFIRKLNLLKDGEGEGWLPKLEKKYHSFVQTLNSDFDVEVCRKNKSECILLQSGKTHSNNPRE
jgi:orotate phosphoribosyltransferase